MRFLLDTHVLLWLASDPQRLSSGALAALRDADELLLSSVSVWELAIKDGLGRLQLPEPLASWVPSRCAALGVVQLAFTAPQAVEVGRLPLQHRDPFDRALVAVARTAGVSIATADRQVAAYDVESLDVVRG